MYYPLKMVHEDCKCPSCQIEFGIDVVPRALVNISANYIFVETYDVWIIPQSNSFMIKWKSTSICFVHSWKTRFLAMGKAVWLSQLSHIGPLCKIPRSKSKVLSHLSSQVIVAIERYFASIEECDMVCCFLVFQEMGECPKNINQPVIKHRVRGQPAQSESHHPCN